jgi:hypothetical protein
LQCCPMRWASNDWIPRWCSWIFKPKYVWPTNDMRWDRLAKKPTSLKSPKSSRKIGASRCPPRNSSRASNSLGACWCVKQIHETQNDEGSPLSNLAIIFCILRVA